MPRHREAESEDIPQASGSDALQAIDALYNLEMRANLMALQHQRRKERVSRSLSEWADYWPMALGILVSLFAPQLREFVEPYRPWGLWVSFPMVALTLRPEMNFSSEIAALLPTIMLYVQFPLEGLLAKVALKGHVTPYGVMVHVLYFHGLCIMELWLVNGGLWHLMGK